MKNLWQKIKAYAAEAASFFMTHWPAILFACWLLIITLDVVHAVQNRKRIKLERAAVEQIIEQNTLLLKLLDQEINAE